MESRNSVSEHTGMHTYDSSRGKIFLSFRWLVHQAYGGGRSSEGAVPKEFLLEPVHNGYQATASAFHGLHLSVALLTSLASGDLYSSACARLFSHWATEWSGHSCVLEALLSRCGILVVDDNGTAVSEQDLRTTRPFNVLAHLALIEAIMTAVSSECLSYTEVMQAIRSFPTVHASGKLPSNLEDALLTWMNAAATSAALTAQAPTVVESLRSLSNGLALALTISAYQPQQLSSQEVIMRAPISAADAAHNLHLVKSFCDDNMATVCFDFTVDDLAHGASGCLKCHLVAFLTDLFTFLVRPLAAGQGQMGTHPEIFVKQQGQIHSMKNAFNGNVHLEDGHKILVPEGKQLQSPQQTSFNQLGSGLDGVRESAVDRPPLTSAATHWESAKDLSSAAALPQSQGGSWRAESRQEPRYNLGQGRSLGSVAGKPTQSSASDSTAAHSEAFRGELGHLSEAGSSHSSLLGGRPEAAAVMNDGHSIRYLSVDQARNGEWQNEERHGGHVSAQASDGYHWTNQRDNEDVPHTGRTTRDTSDHDGAFRYQDNNFGKSRPPETPPPLGSSNQSSIAKSIMSLQDKWKKESEVKDRLNSGAVSPVNFSVVLGSLDTTKAVPLKSADPSVVRGDADGRTDVSLMSPASSSPSQRPELSKGYRNGSSTPRPLSDASAAAVVTAPQPEGVLSRQGYTSSGHSWSPGLSRTSTASPQPSYPVRSQREEDHWSSSLTNNGDKNSQQPIVSATSTGVSSRANSRGSPLKAFMTATRRSQSPSPGGQASPPDQSLMPAPSSAHQGGLLSSSQLRRIYGSTGSLHMAGASSSSEGAPSPLAGRSSPLLLATRMSPANVALATDYGNGGTARGQLDFASPAVTHLPAHMRQGQSSNIAVANPGGRAPVNYVGLLTTRPAEQRSGALSDEGQAHHTPARRESSWESARSFPANERSASPVSSSGGTTSSGRTTPSIVAGRKRATWNRIAPTGAGEGQQSAEIALMDGQGFSEIGYQPPDEELARMRERVMLMELKRKEESERRRQEKEAEALRRREEQRLQEMESERKKAEERQRRERIFEQHQQRKSEEEDEALPLPSSSRIGGGSVQLRSRTSSSRTAARNNFNRHSYAGGGTGSATDFYSSLTNIAEHPAALTNHQQQVFGRLAAPSTSPGVADTPPNGRSHSRTGGHYPAVSGYSEPRHQTSSQYGSMSNLSQQQPTSRYGSMSNLSMRALTPSHGFDVDAASGDELKLFVAPSFKSNRSIIINAISHCVLPGAVNADVKSKVLEDLARSDAKHLLILFRDARMQYRGIYAFNIDTGEASKISGQGPKSITDGMLESFYKYNSGAKNFSSIASTRHLSVTIDAMTIKDALWQKPAPQMPFTNRRP